MASFAVCPRCTSTLEVPESVGAAAQLACPICEVEFSLAAVRPRNLPLARVIERAEAAAGAPPSESGADRLSRLLRSTAERRTPADAPLAAEDTSEEGLASQRADSSVEGAQSEGGASRLDQLLSDLMTSSPIPVPTAPPADREEYDEADAEQEITAEFSNFVGDDERAAEHAADDEIATEEYDLVDAQVDAEEDELVASNFDADASATASGPLQATPRRRRRPSAVKTLVGVVGGGALGILLGAYGLLWISGADGDVLGIAPWLPNALLPDSVQSIAESDADDQAARASAAESLADRTADRDPGEPAGSAQPTTADAAVSARPDADGHLADVRVDSAVTPATASEPVGAEPVGNEPVGNRAAAEPAESPAAAEAVASAGATRWPTTPIVGDLRDASLYSLDDLSAAVTKAQAAQARFLAGDLAKRESVAVMGQSYMDLSSLAERFTLTDPAAFGNLLVTRQMNAKDVFRAVAGNAERRQDLAMISSRWLQHDARQNQGVLLVGRVKDARPRGRWSEYVLETEFADGRLETAVLVDHVRFGIGREVAVAGVIVIDPQQRLAGYDGDAPQLVVAGAAFSPTEERQSSFVPRSVSF